MTQPAFIRRDILELEPYVPGEQPKDQKYIKLNTNENPYPPSPRVLAALQEAVTGSLRLYPDPVSSALRAKAGAVYGFSPDHVLVGNGSDELLTMIMRACLGPGDRVVFPTPTYSLYETLVEIQGGTTLTPPFPENFELPVDALGEQGQRITIVCNPNAPSGTVTPLDVLDRLARRVSGLLLIDEAYVDFGGQTALPLVHQHSNVLVLRTFSKSFALCGMRVGLAFAQPSVIGELNKVKDSYNVGTLPQVAATAALDDYAYMQESAERVRATRSDLSTGLTQRGFDVLPSHANFVLARRRGENLGPLQRKLKERGVLVRWFDTPALCDALRITVGTPDEVAALLRALDG